MKRIYVDGLGLVEGHFSGIGQYILGILRGMDEQIEEAIVHGEAWQPVIVIIPYNTVARFKSFNFKHIRYKRYPLPFRYMAALWHRGLLPPHDLICGFGTYIFPRFVSMPLAFSKSVLVVYDLSFELYKEFSEARNAAFMSKFVGKSVRRTQGVIAISKSARDEIISFYKVKPSRVKVAYPATDEKLFYRRSDEEVNSVKYKYDIRGKYILALSNLEPRKNLESLVNAYCNLPKAISDEYSLLLVGVSGWKTEKLFSHIIDKVNEGFNIIRPSAYVSDEDKPAIISGASLLVYPSHYEGFGMPPLEALACGTPVIAADNSSLPEAVGNAGVLIDIKTPGLLATTMQQSLSNLGTISASTIESGPLHAEQFSWRTSAQTILNAVKEIER